MLFHLQLVTLSPPKSPHYHPPILYALTNEHWTSQATASSLPSNRVQPTSSHKSAVHQAAQQTTRRHHRAISRLLWIPSTLPVEYWLCGDLKASEVWEGMMPLWRGFPYCYIYFYFVLHTPMIRGIRRNPRTDVISERVPLAW
jgi:hypothetical protein